MNNSALSLMVMGAAWKAVRLVNSRLRFDSVVRCQRNDTMLHRIDLSKLRPTEPVSKERRKELDEMLQRAIAAGKELKDKYGIELVCDVC